MALLLITSPPFRAGNAQVSVESNLVVSNAFVWRGLTTTNRAVLQPDMTISAPVGQGRLSVGGWASIEPARYDGPSDISAVYGLLPGPAFTQYSVWLEHDIELRGVALTTGVNANLYPAVADLAAMYNTVELSAVAAFPLSLAPTLSVQYDVGAVRGAYYEASIGVDRDVRNIPVSVRLLAGVNAGQGPDAAAQAYFARRGVTHLEFSASTTHQRGGLTIAPTLHVISGFDPLTKVTAPSRTRALKLWFGTTISWASASGESSE